MESNQYSDFGEGSGYAVERKTSVLAIVAFALTVICCLPVVAQIGLLLGVVSVAMIAKSGGRKGGMGFGVAAIVLGLIGTGLWIGVLVAANAAAGMLGGLLQGPVDQTLTAARDGDVAAMQTHFKPAAAALITDEALTEFQAAYIAEFGEYVSAPADVWEWGSALPGVEQELEAIQGTQQIVPIPVENANGPSLVVVQIPSDEDAMSKMLNLGVVIDGQVRWLIDPTTAEFRNAVRSPDAASQGGGANAPNEDEEDPEGG